MESTPQNLPVATSAAEILAADDLRNKLVPIPLWGVSVWVRNLWGNERDIIERLGKKENTSALLTRMVTWCAVTGPGRNAGNLFTPQQVEALNRKNAGPIVQLAKVIQELSGLTEDDISGVNSDLPNDLNGSDGFDTLRPSDAPSPSYSAD
jgi:hypothetical protein